MEMRVVFDERRARSATTICEAEQCLIDFMREGASSHSHHHIKERSHGFDLYLPWFIEVVENRSPYADVVVLGIPDLERLYMDAAWSLVMKGILRPGPMYVGDEVDRNAYGKAFTQIAGVHV